MIDLSPYYEWRTVGCAANAPVVVFLPGVGCGAFLFEDAVKTFLPDFKLLLINNPGLNDTECPLVLRVEDIAHLVFRVMDSLGIQKAHLVGHSMGGFTAQEMALQQPERIGRLVLVSTSYGGPQNQQEMTRIAAEVGMDAWDFYKTFKGENDRAIAFTFSESYRELFPEKYAQFVAFHQKNWANQAVIARHFMCGARYSSFMEAYKISHEALVIHGDEDHMIAFDGGEKLARQLPLNRFLPIANCGHFPFEERENLWDVMKRFVEGEKGIGTQLPNDPALQGFDWSKFFNWGI